MSWEIDKIIMTLTKLLEYYKNREGYLENEYQSYITGNFWNKILLWIDTKIIEEETFEPSRLVIKDPIYLLVNDLLNYISLDKYDSLINLLDSISKNENDSLFTEVPEDHEILLKDKDSLYLVQLMMGVFSRRFKSTKENLREIILKLDEESDLLLLAKTLKQSGKYLYKNGEADQALYYLQIGSDICKERLNKTPDKELEMEYGYILNLTGLNFLHRGKGPLEYFTEALDIFKRLENTIFQIHCYTNIGIYHWRMNDLALSEEFISKAYNLHEKMGNKWGMASTSSNLGVLMLQQKEFSRALDYNLRAVTHYNSIEDGAIDSELANSYLGIAESLMYLGGYEEAEEYFIRVMDIYYNVPNTVEYHKTAIGYARLKMHLREYEEAITILEKKVLHDQLGKHEGFENQKLYRLAYLVICHSYLENYDMVSVYAEEAEHIVSDDIGMNTIQRFIAAFIKSNSDDLGDLSVAESMFKELLDSDSVLSEFLQAEASRKLVSILWWRFEIKKSEEIALQLRTVLTQSIKMSAETRMISILMDLLISMIKLDIIERNQHLLVSLTEAFETASEFRGSKCKEALSLLETIIAENKDLIKHVLTKEKDETILLKFKERVNTD